MHGDTEKAKKTLAANDREFTRMILKDCFGQATTGLGDEDYAEKNLQSTGQAKVLKNSRLFALIRG
jgi:hypothetical protein